jgi:heme A synthase
MAGHFLHITGWYFLSNTTWWVTLAVAMAFATLPSLLKSLRLFLLLLIALLWLASLIFMAVIAGFFAALAGGAISLLWALLLLLISLIFSGVQQMANKRYG